MDDLQVELALLLSAMPIEIDDDAAAGEDVLDVLDVVQRGRGAEALGVRAGERFLVPLVQLDPFLFASGDDERIEQPVGPCPRSLGEVFLDALRGDLRNLSRRG